MEETKEGALEREVSPIPVEVIEAEEVDTEAAEAVAIEKKVARGTMIEEKVETLPSVLKEESVRPEVEVDSKDDLTAHDVLPEVEAAVAVTDEPDDRAKTTVDEVTETRVEERVESPEKEEPERILDLEQEETVRDVSVALKKAEEKVERLVVEEELVVKKVVVEAAEESVVAVEIVEAEGEPPSEVDDSAVEEEVVEKADEIETAVVDVPAKEHAPSLAEEEEVTSVPEKLEKVGEEPSEVPVEEKVAEEVREAAVELEASAEEVVEKDEAAERALTVMVEPIGKEVTSVGVDTAPSVEAKDDEKLDVSLGDEVDLSSKEAISEPEGIPEDVIPSRVEEGAATSEEKVAEERVKPREKEEPTEEIEKQEVTDVVTEKEVVVAQQIVEESKVVESVTTAVEKVEREVVEEEVVEKKMSIEVSEVIVERIVSVEIAEEEGEQADVSAVAEEVAIEEEEITALEEVSVVDVPSKEPISPVVDVPKEDAAAVTPDVAEAEGVVEEVEKTSLDVEEKEEEVEVEVSKVVSVEVSVSEEVSVPQAEEEEAKEVVVEREVSPEPVGKATEEVVEEIDQIVESVAVEKEVWKEAVKETVPSAAEVVDVVEDSAVEEVELVPKEVIPSEELVTEEATPTEVSDEAAVEDRAKTPDEKETSVEKRVGSPEKEVEAEAREEIVDVVSEDEISVVDESKVVETSEERVAVQMEEVSGKQVIVEYSERISEMVVSEEKAEGEPVRLVDVSEVVEEVVEKVEVDVVESAVVAELSGVEPVSPVVEEGKEADVTESEGFVVEVEKPSDSIDVMASLTSQALNLPKESRITERSLIDSFSTSFASISSNMLGYGGTGDSVDTCLLTDSSSPPFFRGGNESSNVGASLSVSPSRGASALGLTLRQVSGIVESNVDKSPDFNFSGRDQYESGSLDQTVIPDSTVGTVGVPISDDGESQSDIFGSQASATTYLEITEEPRRPFLSKSRREQLSILTRKVLTEKEIKDLMIEVKEVTRQIKQEVRELKPDLTPTPEGPSFPSQGFIDDTEFSLSSILEEHPVNHDPSRAGSTSVDKHGSGVSVSELEGFSSSSLPSDFKDSYSVEPLYFPSIPPSSASFIDTQDLSNISESKDVKVVTILEEEVVLDNVLETVVDEIQTVERRKIDDLEHKIMSHTGDFSFPPSMEIVGRTDQEMFSGPDTSALSEAQLDLGLSDAAIEPSRVIIKRDDLQSDSIQRLHMISMEDPDFIADVTEIPQQQLFSDPVITSRSVVSHTSASVREVDDISESALVQQAIESTVSDFSAIKEESETYLDQTTVDDHSLYTVKAQEDILEEQGTMPKEPKESLPYRPILEVTSDDIVLKDDDTIEITVSEDPSKIYSSTSAHSHIETTIHTSSSGAKFVEIVEDGQRSICVCETIVESQVLVPKESTSQIKKPPDTPATGKKSTSSVSSKSRAKEPVSEVQVKRSTDSTKTTSESHDNVRKRPTSSRYSSVLSDTEGALTRKKVGSKHAQVSDVHSLPELQHKGISILQPDSDEHLPRVRSNKRSHYAEDTASSSSKKVAVTHRREEGQYSRTSRSMRESPDKSDKSPVSHRSQGRKDGELDQSHVTKKRSSESDKKVSVKDDISKDGSATSKKPGTSMGSGSLPSYPESRKSAQSKKGTLAPGTTSKLPRSSISTKKKEAPKLETDAPHSPDTLPPTVTTTATSLVRQSTTNIQKVSTTKYLERTTTVSTKQERKTKSHSKVPKPTKSSVEILPSTSAPRIEPLPTKETEEASSADSPEEQITVGFSHSQLTPKALDSSPEGSVTVMTSTPSPSFCQPSSGFPDSASQTPSLPSSPSRMRHSSAASGSITQLMTSEVFTRTLDVTGAIEVIYRQPTTSESVRRIAPSKSTQLSIETSAITSGTNISSQLDSSQIDTTDSSLSDSIALPSSSSDLDFSGAQEGCRQSLSRSGTFAPPQRTSHPTTPSRLSPSPSSITTSQPSHRRTARTTQVSEERLSPILDVRAVTPPRVKHKFEYMAGDEVEEAGEHPQGKRLTPHHSARCHQLFSTSASVQSMASDLEQIISDVRKSFWPPEFSPERTNQLLEALQNRAESLSKLAVKFPKQYGINEGKLECGRHGHEHPTSVVKDSRSSSAGNTGALTDPPSRYISESPEIQMSNECHGVAQQHSDLGWKRDLRRESSLQKTGLLKEPCHDVSPTSVKEVASGDRKKSLPGGDFHIDSFGVEGVGDNLHLIEITEYYSSPESESDYALIESSNNLEVFDDASTDEDEDLIPVDLSDPNLSEEDSISNLTDLATFLPGANILQELSESQRIGGTVLLPDHTIEGEIEVESMDAHSSGVATMSLKESNVPQIAITSDNDMFDGDIDDALENNVANIDAHTDIEDLEDDFDDMNISRRQRKPSLSPKPGDDGALTDIEDMEGSGDEDEEIQIDLSSPQIFAALEGILDSEGTYEELFKHDSLSNSGKTVVSTGQPSFQGLGIPEDSRASGVLTDVEDFSGSEDENLMKDAYKEVDTDFLMEMLENVGTVDISDTLKKQSKTPSPAHTPSRGSSPYYGRMSPDKESGIPDEELSKPSTRSGRRSPTYRSGLSPIPPDTMRRLSDVTDTEILESDSDEERTRAVLSRTRRHQSRGKSSLQPPIVGKGSATDIEDVEFTDDESAAAYAKVVQYNTSDHSKQGIKLAHKHKQRNKSSAGDNFLGIPDDHDEGRTDIEDLEASGTEDEIALEEYTEVKEHPESVFSIEEMESMYGSVMESQTTLDVSEGQAVSMENQLTDTEELGASSPAKFQRSKDYGDQSSISSGCSTEEGSLQGSDTEVKSNRKNWREGRISSGLPVTEVKFFDRGDGSDPVPVIFSPDASKESRKFAPKAQTSSLLIPKSTDGGATDVEELLSSGESDSDDIVSNTKEEKIKIRGDYDSEDPLTDLEDFETDNLDEIYFSHKLPSDLNPEDVPGFPPPVRELTLVKQDEHGHPTVLVLPLDEVKARGLFMPDESGAALTDVEDIEDSGDESDDQELGLRVIDAEGNRTLLITPDLPPIEGGIIECTDTMKVERKKLKIPSQAMADPITDTEEMFLDTSPAQRKRKVRSRPQLSHSKKSPQPSSPTVVASATVMSNTDVEELEVSDIDSVPPGVRISKGPSKKAGDDLDNTPNTSDAKTDVEDMAASDVDEHIDVYFERPRSATPDLMQGYDQETITEKQGDGPFTDDVRERVTQRTQMRSSGSKHQSRKHASLGSVPTIRMTSPSPDIPPTTDTEDIFASADEGRESPTPETSYEIEEHSSVVHVKNSRKIDVDAPGEAKHIKGHQGLDVLTDVEEVGLSEEEGQHYGGDANVDYAAEASEETGKLSEAVLSQMSIYDGKEKVCVCVASKNKNSASGKEEVCICIGKPQGDISIVPGSSALSETDLGTNVKADVQSHESSQGPSLAEGSTEERTERMHQKHGVGGMMTAEDAGSEFYQTQDPESTSEYDPSQPTIRTRVVIARTHTKTVMGEDGRPVTITTTETEVDDGSGADGILDSNQLRESMQQIIDEFASGEDGPKEGKETKEEKKPE